MVKLRRIDEYSTIPISQIDAETMTNYSISCASGISLHVTEKAIVFSHLLTRIIRYYELLSRIRTQSTNIIYR